MNNKRSFWVTIARLLEWNDRDKALLLAALMAPMMGSYLAWLYVTAHFTDFGHTFFSVPGVVLAQQIFLGNVLGWVLLLIWGGLLRWRDRDCAIYPTVTIQFFGFGFVALGYVIGLYNPMLGLVLVGGPLTGFALFGIPRVAINFTLCLLLLFVIVSLSISGKIEYAPLFKADPVTKHYQSSYWILSVVGASVPFVTTMFVFTLVLLGRLQFREAQMHARAVTDALTGLSNRRALFEQLEYEMARARRTGNALSVCLLDLDYFKKINDSHGHAAGDAVLCAVADLLRENLRDTDRIGRIGGEEFLLVLPDTDRAGARSVIERCQQSFRAHRVAVAGLSAPLRFSASFGIACLEPDDELEETVLVARADEALYLAKHQGRDCIAFWEAAQSSPLPEGA
ncbi:sensor histidine kinase [Alcanivorax hongdengensis A-11-3]|uniref:diguanylate cyclase n=1 Tax=Alcanivorax hongdengensis A-11-3 TaxID=1177179 RepID=L0W995_9GAMM|nr:GGDEF domain-containing protein [Alcanivorax hongdengensis]EKF73511.1 sensor histidine kinase [Alcanivorax hongdengensis A-11-3]